MQSRNTNVDLSDISAPQETSSTIEGTQRPSATNLKYRMKSKEKQQKKKKLLGNAHALDLKVLFDTYFRKPEKLGAAKKI